MPTKAVEAGLNKQITMEFDSAYLYLSMAAYFEQQSLPGFGHWMRLQHQEELSHGMKLFNFVLDNGGRVELETVAKPLSEFDSPLGVMLLTLQHEEKVTASINKLYELALSEKDYPTQLVLQWFIAEQTEEEKTVGEIIAQLRMIGDNGSAMLMIDRRLAARQ